MRPTKDYLENQRTLLEGRIAQIALSQNKESIWRRLQRMWQSFIGFIADTRQPVWAVAMYAVIAFVIGRYTLAPTPAPQTDPNQLRLQEILEQGMIRNARLYYTGNTSQPLQVALETTEYLVVSGDLGDSQLQELVQYLALNDKNVGNRLKAIDFLQHNPLPEDAQLVLISSMLTDVNSGVRMKAARALQSIETTSPTLLQACQKVLLEEENDAVRKEAITILSRFPDPSIIPTLRVVNAMDENVYIRNQAREILALLGSSAFDDEIEVLH
ncbi:MAG: HEAT repeat domain-containing protein, partial [Fidelibacterota bacterium]